MQGTGSDGLLLSQWVEGHLEISATPITVQGERSVLVRLWNTERSRGHDLTQNTVYVELNAGLRGVLDGLRELLHSDLAAVAFYDESRREVRWQVTSGHLTSQLTNIRLRPGQGFAGRIVMTSLPLVTRRFSELTSDPESYPIFLAEGLESAVGVPILYQDRILGVLMVANRQPREYTQQDVQALTHMADSISLAVEMVRLYGKAVDAERVRLAQEVHDGLSQNLFALQLLITDLQENLRSDSPETVEQGLQRVCRVLDSTLSEVRRLIADLRGEPPVKPGLIHAMSDYLSYFYRFSKLQVELALRIPPGEEVYCRATDEVIRIVQEALMNVHRHANARRVRVELAAQPECYVLTIEDDGRGFDPEAPVPEGHYGRTIMQERAERLDGTLEISSAPGSGTVVRLRIPRTPETPSVCQKPGSIATT